MDGEIALLINPTSGGGKGARAGNAAAARLRGAGLAVRELVGRDAEESRDLAREAVERGAAGLVVVGGDGMVHLGLQAAGGTDVPFGVIPAGSGNDFARSLGIPLADPEAAAGVVAAAHERKIDLGRSGGTWFGCVVAAGFDARVNDRANRMRWPRGRMRYNIAMLAELGVFRPIRYRMELDGEEWSTDAMLVTIGNAPSYGGGMKVTPDAELDDELLDVMVVKPISKMRLLMVFPKVYSGAHVRLPYVEVRRARRVHVEADSITAYVDGERLGPLPQTFEAVPAALRVFVPAPPS
ncbi:MAG TPA: diacylglycerol kinase [Jiangellaceae bacterium]|nr:diacylglycerol kinase [Jiangellaceae bacterium]